MPTIACPFRAMGQERMVENRSEFRNLTVFGRLADDSSVERATAEAEALQGRFAPDHPETYGEVEGLGVRAVALA